MTTPLAICGGSFNPVHYGHLHMGRIAVERFGYGSVLYIPVARPPHKTDREMVSGRHRLAMLRLALASYDWAAIDDREMRRGGASYTIDTLRELLSEPQINYRPALLIGDDLADDFDQWKEADEIIKLCDIILYRREGSRQKKVAFPCRQVEDFTYAISSSQLRQAINGDVADTIVNMLPPPVWQYIQREGLYRHAKSGR